MSVLNRYEGVLKMCVSSEGKMIPAGTKVVIENIETYMHLETRVTSWVNGVYKCVRLPFYGTDVSNLI